MESIHCPAHILDPVIMASDPIHHHLTIQLLLARFKGVAGIPAAVDNGAFKIDMNNSSFDLAVRDISKKAVAFDLLCLLYTQAQSSLSLCHSQISSCSSLVQKKRLLRLMRITVLPHLRVGGSPVAETGGTCVQDNAAARVLQQLEISLGEKDRSRASETYLSESLSLVTETLLVPSVQLSVSALQLARLAELTASEKSLCLSTLQDYLSSGNEASRYEGWAE